LELFRPELEVDPDIVERERRFNEEGPDREEWVLNHIYLCAGDLEELKKHPSYRPFDPGFIFSSFPSRKRHKKVRVAVKRDVDKETTIMELERRLKIEIYIRGCNSGVFYRLYDKNDTIVGEATPARLDCE